MQQSHIASNANQFQSKYISFFWAFGPIYALVNSNYMDSSSLALDMVMAFIEIEFKIGNWNAERKIAFRWPCHRASSGDYFRFKFNFNKNAFEFERSPQ